MSELEMSQSTRFLAIIRIMDTIQENKILGLPRRPRVGDGNSGALVGGIAGALVSGNWVGAILGGLAGNALATQPQNLEFAVRDYFAKTGLQVAFFYRAPRAIKVTFTPNNNAYWTIESIMPNGLNLSPEDAEDWLYGNLVEKELPKKIRKIQTFLAQ